MKTLVIYRSKTGFTRKYAEWIAQELSADISEASKVSASGMTGYDTIIYGGWVCAGAIKGLKLVTGNLERLKDKKVIVFACGLAKPEGEEANEVKRKNLTPGHLKRIRYFYFRGGLDMSKMGFFARLIMKMVRKVIEKESREPGEKDILDAFESAVDYTDRDNIRELVAYARQQS
jgi:menaquinone-dependent protoporphyrinogen IX oxidase